MPPPVKEEPTYEVEITDFITVVAVKEEEEDDVDYENLEDTLSDGSNDDKGNLIGYLPMHDSDTQQQEQTRVLHSDQQHNIAPKEEPHEGEKTHLPTHTSKKPFVCELCNQSFRQKQQLISHNNLYHLTNPKEKRHRCRYCKRLYAYKGNLIRHLTLHDRQRKIQSAPSSEEKEDVILKRKNSNNVGVYDGVNDAEEDVEESSGNGNITKNPKKKVSQYTCSSCSYTSPMRYMLKRHMKSHSEERPHLCQICERGFKTLHSLHIHVDTHSGLKPHTCITCQSKFATSAELVRHVRYKHTHEKPYKCPQCDYACVEPSKLRRHMLSHTGERPYQCKQCSYRSLDTFKLKRHMRTHTGEKPYKCEQCNMYFTQSNSLKAHKLIHNKSTKPVYACDLCPATRSRKVDLRYHIQNLHTSNRPIKCKRCRQSFPDKYSYKIHSKTH